MSLHCPNCGHKQVCPCDACKQKASEEDKQIKPWEWVGGIGIRCGNCGFEEAADWWEGLSYDICTWTLSSLKNKMRAPITKEVNKFLDVMKIHNRKTPLGG